MEIAVTITASIASLVLGTLLGAELSRFLYKPRVLIRYKNIAPLNLENGTFWSLRVENKGRSVAASCVGTLSIDELQVCDLLHQHEADADEGLPDFDNSISEEFPRKQILNPGYFRDVQASSLCWSKLGNPDVIDINPGISRTLDVCKFHIGAHENYFIFPSEFGWKTIRLRSRASQITGEIKICPANEFPTRIRFKLSASGNESKLECASVGVLKTKASKSAKPQTPG